ncbi:MAG: carboxypeptidase regulatory-like domain-containing protein [bacterium]|nr:carboxypeptidase regulatory-like domain-containing protein [bacterium]
MYLKKISAACIMTALLFAIYSCNGSGTTNDPEPETGNITGTVYSESTGNSIANVKVSADNRGSVYTTTTNESGEFSLDVGTVTRGEGLNVHFSENNFENGTRAALFELANLRVALGKISLTDSGTNEARTITGTVLDSFGNTGLAGVQVSVQNSNNETITAVSGSDGTFELSGTYFSIGSSYAVTLEKEYYITESSVSVTIEGGSNVITNNPVHLYLNHGTITGIVQDDDTGNALAGATASVVDSNGDTVTANTDSSGAFTLTGNYFYLGTTYSVAVTKANYRAGASTVQMELTGENTMAGSPLKLYIDAQIAGTVQGENGEVIAGVQVEAKDSSGTTLDAAATGSDGTFSVTSTAFQKNAQYELTFTSEDYETLVQTSAVLDAGENGFGTITLNEKTRLGHTITGTVVDWRDNTIKIPASVSITDMSNVTRTATCDAQGAFTVTGDFMSGETYTLETSYTGYTGLTDVDKNTTAVSILVSSPQNIGNVYLYPIGIYAEVNGSSLSFGTDVKQSHEKFLTGKSGFTLSGRNSANLNTASSFYIHVDDKENILPSAPGGVHSSLIVANGEKAQGAVSNGILGDSRTSSLNMTNSVMYHFYAAGSGDFVLSTSGSTNTVLTLYNSAGSTLATDDNSGDDTNAKITAAISSAGWYFVKVSGYDDNTYGSFELTATGSDGASGGTGSWSTDDLILSWYSNTDKVIYIAGNNESGSSGSVQIDTMDGRAGIARGFFSGTLRAVTSAGGTVPVSNGYFNIIRSE